MQGKCVFLMEFIGYFTFGLHKFTYPWTHVPGQLTDGFPHLTHDLSYELNELSHWLTGWGRGSMDITPQLRTIEFRHHCVMKISQATT